MKRLCQEGVDCHHRQNLAQDEKGQLHGTEPSAAEQSWGATWVCL